MASRREANKKNELRTDSRSVPLPVPEIFWPKTNLTQTFEDVAVDQAIEITEGEKEFRRLKLGRVRFGGNS